VSCSSDHDQSQTATWLSHAVPNIENSNVQILNKIRKIRGKLIPRFVRLTIPYLKSEHRWVAWGLIILLIGLMLADTSIAVMLNWQTGEFSTALAEQDSDRYWKSTYLTIALIVIGFPTYGLYYYVRDRLTLHWRGWMTKEYTSKYFGDRRYYQLTYATSIDNPDQRMSDDINSFTSKSIYFLLIFIETFLQIIAFSGVLWYLSHTLVWTLVIYAVVGTLFTTLVFGRPLVALNFFQLKNEADFRYSLIRVRENAESIAFYRGEDKERGYVHGRFGEVLSNSKRLINWQFFLNSFQSLYTSATYVIPAIILAPSVLKGEMEVGAVVQATGAFAKVFSALNVVVSKFDQLSYFTAGVGRLDRFSKSLQDAEPASEASPRIESHEVPADSISAFNQVSLETPDGKRRLIEDFELEIQPGTRLLIVGASGGGKSSLLRAFAGLWTQGKGVIARPPLDDILFLPQRPYMVVGTLRDQFLYPNNDPQLTDQDLCQALESVRLPKLVDRFGGLDASCDWSKTLSLGEQQRVALARVFLSQQKFIVLDEATSALDEKNESEVYDKLAAAGATLISISHRPSVARFHNVVLQIDGEGGWAVLTPEQYQESLLQG
jgi:vitamin B12/bleomycin/antimicrobial peptide transport system ATP-binding/permease protein